MPKAIHPEILRRFMDNQRKHRSAIPVGKRTAAEAVKAIDPDGILSHHEYTRLEPRDGAHPECPCRACFEAYDMIPPAPAEE